LFVFLQLGKIDFFINEFKEAAMQSCGAGGFLCGSGPEFFLPYFLFCLWE
jgi:hypothetical protein